MAAAATDQEPSPQDAAVGAAESMLLDQVLDAISDSQRDGGSVVERVASAGHHELLIKLLQRAHSLAPAAIGGLATTFMAEARRGNMQCLHALLHAAGPARLAHATDAGGFTLLQRCAEAGREECVRLLLSADSPGCQVAATGARGITALMLSAWHGLVACMRELLSHSPTQQVEAASTAVTALTYCVAKGHREGVALLLQHSPEAQIAAAAVARRQTPLMYAAARGDAACAAMLLVHCPNVQVAAVTAAPSSGTNNGGGDRAHSRRDTRCSGSYTTIPGRSRGHGLGHRPHAAAPALPVPCDATADEDPAEHATPGSPVPAQPSGWNALMFACDGGHAEVAALLLRHSPGVQVAAADSGGRNAAMLAARSGHEACLELCLAHGPDAQVAAEDRPEGGILPGRSALAQAAAAGHERCVRIILARLSPHAARRQVGILDSDFRPALSYAVEGGREGCVRALLEVNPEGQRLGDALLLALHANLPRRLKLAGDAATAAAGDVRARILRLLVAKGARLPPHATKEEADAVWRAMQELMSQALKAGRPGAAAGAVEKGTPAAEGVEVDQEAAAAAAGGGAGSKKRKATGEPGSEVERCGKTG